MTVPNLVQQAEDAVQDGVVQLPQVPTVEDASSEPLRDKAFWLGLLAAALGFGAAFGLDLSQVQIGAALTLAGPLVVIGLAYFGRKDVVPVGKANAAIKVAAALPEGTPVQGFRKG